MIGFSFIAIDGDDIGRNLEKLLLEEDFSKLISFSNTVKNYFNLVKKIALKYNSEILLFGGDSVIIKIESKNIENFIVDLNKIQSNITVSIGIGQTVKHAFFALKEAKALGRNRIIYFNKT
jgi:GTP cyclohydrolase III